MRNQRSTGGKKFAFVFVKSMQQPWSQKKKNEGGKDRRKDRFLALCRTDGPRSPPIYSFLRTSNNFPTFLSLSPSLSLRSPRFSYFPPGKEKRKKSGRNKCNTRFQALINFSSLGSLNSCVPLLSIET